MIVFEWSKAFRPKLFQTERTRVTHLLSFASKFCHEKNSKRGLTEFIHELKPVRKILSRPGYCKGHLLGCYAQLESR